jgi:CheY-like chemotaxis protein
MPGVDGLEVLAQLDSLATLPRIVFITSYDRHAARAFEVNAVDYLLKPVSRDRFDRAIDRCLEPLLSRPDVAPFLEEVARLAPQRLLIRDRGRIQLLPVARTGWSRKGTMSASTSARGATCWRRRWRKWRSCALPVASCAFTAARWRASSASRSSTARAAGGFGFCSWTAPS